MALDLSDILKLPIAERILAVEAIWDSIAVENKQYPLTTEEVQELHERWEEYKRTPGSGLSWDEVKSSILKDS
jgi:putative addiction module component (TIGR02574 family)